MKKSLVILCAGAVCFLVSCNNDKKEASGGMSEVAQKNVAAFNTVSDAFTSGDLTKIDSVVASDFVDHSGMHGVDGNRDTLKAMVTMMSMDKTAKTETKLQLANDDYVAGWLHMTGTSNGDMGPKGAPYDMSGIELVKFKDGKAVEHWSFMSMADVMKMMPQPGMDNKMDSTKKKM